MQHQNSIEKLNAIFLDIENQNIQENIITFLEKVADLSKNESNHFAIKNKLNNTSLADYVSHQNTEYLARFIKCMTQTKSKAVKNKMLELIEAMTE